MTTPQIADEDILNVFVQMNIPYKSATGTTGPSGDLTEIFFNTDSNKIAYRNDTIGLVNIAPEPTGPINYQKTSTSRYSTTSKSFTIVENMSITPSAGKYLIMFTGYGYSSSSNGQVYFSLYVGGSQITHTLRKIKKANPTPISIQSIETVNGSQAVEIKFKNSSNGNGYIFERTLSLIKISD